MQRFASDVEGMLVQCVRLIRNRLNPIVCGLLILRVAVRIPTHKKGHFIKAILVLGQLVVEFLVPARDRFQRNTIARAEEVGMNDAAIEHQPVLDGIEERLAVLRVRVGIVLEQQLHHVSVSTQSSGIARCGSFTRLGLVGIGP